MTNGTVKCLAIRKSIVVPADRLAFFFALIVIFLCVAVPNARASDYVVKPGDTLSSIAKTRLDSADRWQEIARLNRISSPYRISVGQHLALPGKTTSQQTAGTTIPAPHQIPTASPALSPQLLIALLVALFIVWLFTAVSLRVACWFSLVETSLVRCALFSLLLAGLYALAFALMAGVYYLQAFQGSSFVQFPVLVIGLGIAYLIACASLIHPSNRIN